MAAIESNPLAPISSSPPSERCCLRFHSARASIIHRLVYLLGSKDDERHGELGGRAVDRPGRLPSLPGRIRFLSLKRESLPPALIAHPCSRRSSLVLLSLSLVCLSLVSLCLSCAKGELRKKGNKGTRSSGSKNPSLVACSDDISEVVVKGGNGYRNEKLEDYVNMYYSVEKFRASYEGVIPSIRDKSQWHKSSHGFFMYPLLLKSTASRRKTERYKSCIEGGSTSRKGQHKCPICKDYSHHWHNCKNSDLADIAAMLVERGPPKKRKKKDIEAPCETSIVPAGPTTMVFPSPPTSPVKKRRTTTTRSKGPTTGSNQPEFHLLMQPDEVLQTPRKKKAMEKKQLPKEKKVAKKKKCKKGKG